MGNVFDQLYQSNKRDRLLADYLKRPPVEDPPYIAPFDLDGNEDVLATNPDSQDTPVNQESDIAPLDFAENKDVLATNTDSQDTPVDKDALAAPSQTHSIAHYEDLMNSIFLDSIFGPPLETAYATTDCPPRATLPLPHTIPLPDDPPQESTSMVGKWPVHSNAIERARGILPLPQNPPTCRSDHAVVEVSRGSSISSQPQSVGAPKRRFDEQETCDGSARNTKSKRIHTSHVLQDEALAIFIISLPDPPVLCPGQLLFNSERGGTDLANLRLLFFDPDCNAHPPTIPSFVRMDEQCAVETLKRLRDQSKLAVDDLMTENKKKTRSEAQASALTVDKAPTSYRPPPDAAPVSNANVTTPSPKPAVPIQTQTSLKASISGATFFLPGQWGNTPLHRNPLLFTLDL